MRHLLRWAFDLAAIVSALLFVAICVFWMRSDRRIESVTRNMLNVRWTVWSANGLACIQKAQYLTPDARRPRLPTWSADSVRQAKSPFLDWPRHGLGFGTQRNDRISGTNLLIFAPHWAISLLTLGVPAGWMFASGAKGKRRNRKTEAFCVTCGYDLRATHDRCPECGTVPVKTR